MEEDYEKILMEREEDLYEEKISNSKIRNNHFELKNRAYNEIISTRNPLPIVFLGYLDELNFLDDDFFTLLLTFLQSDFSEKIELILKKKIKSREEIKSIILSSF